MMKLHAGMWKLREFFFKAFQKIVTMKRTTKETTMANKPTPPLPNIPDLTREQFHRLLAADYLVALAGLIRKGTVSGFDMAWDERFEKPAGKVMMSTAALQSPLEQRVLEQIQEEREQAERQIDVSDMTEALQDHHCDNPACLACNDPSNRS
jgi:hypothetical protein